MDARLDAHVDLDKPDPNSDLFHITWPDKLPKCHGVCGLTEGRFDGDRRFISSDEVRQHGERGCPRCMIIYSSYRDLDLKGAEVEVDCHADEPGMIRLHRTRSIRHWPHHTVQVYVELGTPEPAWEHIKPRRILTTKRRDDYKPILHSWIDNCIKSHTDCMKTDSALPHTVLDVGSQDNPHLSLHVSSNRVGQYTALSHCWGTSNPPKTTTLNIEQYKRHINFDELPKSFQDAVTVTRDLGIRCLWIDSLCIQQDNIDDWQRESSKMADYYNHAYLVIAASQAENPTQGFLDSIHDSSDITRQSRTHIGNIINPNSNISRIYREEISQPYWWQRHSAPLGYSPLNRRAWVLQEHLLAKRIVHFTANELLWECVENLDCECLETKNCSWGEQGNGGIVRKSQFLDIDRLNKNYTRLQQWLSLLNQYSTLSITKGSDVLPALSGLAKFWQSPETGKYLAGIWEKNITESIVWVRQRSRDGPYAGRALQRSRKYRAPSWSPFSIEDADRYHDRRMLIPIYHPERVDKKCVVVLNAGVTAAGADSTGQVKSGYLELEGLVTRLDIEPQDNHAMETEIELQGRRTEVEWDIELDLRQGLHVVLLYMVDDGDFLRALVLKTCQGGYERVGILPRYKFYRDKGVFECISKCLQAGTKETVTII